MGTGTANRKISRTVTALPACRDAATHIHVGHTSGGADTLSGRCTTCCYGEVG